MFEFKKSLPSEPKLRLLAIGLMLIIVLMPVHGLFSTFAGHVTGQVELAKAWKEILILLLLSVMVLDMTRNEALVKRFFSDRLNQLMLVYVGFFLLLAAIKQPQIESVIVSLIINLRFLGLFMIGRWMMVRIPGSKFPETIARLVMSAILISVFLAVAQVSVLPASFFEFFGYGPNAIPAQFTLDDNADLIRATGGVRGPNVMAVMTSIYAPFLFAVSFGKIRDNLFNKQSIYLPIVLTAFAAFATYSRSGWLAIALSLVIIAWLLLSPSLRKKFVIPVVALGLAVGAVIILFSGSSATLSTLFLHDDPTSGKKNSTSQHFTANQDAIKDIRAEPFGRGPGTAGPASFYNDSQTRLAENYYLQVAQEVGIVGLIMFVEIIGIVAVRLYGNRKSVWSKVMLASLAGISLAAMFGHSWADEETALIWWGLAGLFIDRKSHSPLKTKRHS